MKFPLQPLMLFLIITDVLAKSLSIRGLDVGLSSHVIASKKNSVFEWPAYSSSR